MDDLDQALRLDPARIDALPPRALLRGAESDDVGALADLDALLRVAPGDDQARQARDSVKARMAEAGAGPSTAR